MPSTAISNRLPAVTIEYDTAKGRTKKHFEDATKAKAFFTTKDKAGKNPKVVGDEAVPATETPTEEPAKAKRTHKAKPAAAAASKPETAADAPAEPKPANVNPKARAVTRICGEVLAKHGLEAGVTQAMVNEVAELAGRKNEHQDWFNLRNAWHAINGYLAATK